MGVGGWDGEAHYRKASEIKRQHGKHRTNIEMSQSGFELATTEKKRSNTSGTLIVMHIEIGF
jgi:hypothetical protein